MGVLCAASLLLLSLLGMVCGQGFDPNQVNQQVGGNFDPNGGGFGGWGWNQVTTSDPGTPTYDPNADNANLQTLSTAEVTTGQPATMGWGIDSQWGFGATGTPAGSAGFGSGGFGSGGFGSGGSGLGVRIRGFGSGSGVTLSELLSGTAEPLAGRK